MIFGGQKTAAYLNDLYILDLGKGNITIWKHTENVIVDKMSLTARIITKGFMEYTTVKYENMPPIARG